MQLEMSEEACNESIASGSSVKKKKKSKKRKYVEIEHCDEREQLDEPNNDDKPIEPMVTDQVKQHPDVHNNDEYVDETDQDETEIKANKSNHQDQTNHQKPDPYSCVEHVSKKIKFPILPIATIQELKVIRQTLIHKWKYRYINELNGFLYYFNNLELIDDNGQLMDDLPFLYYHITADFYVFRPKVGYYLKSKISCFEASNKVINCSTDCELTISIPLPDEISDKLNKYLKLHQEIIFLIQNIDYSKMLIEGTINRRCLKLMEKHVEIISTNETQQEQKDQNESKSKKVSELISNNIHEAGCK